MRVDAVCKTRNQGISVVTFVWLWAAAAELVHLLVSQENETVFIWKDDQGLLTSTYQDFLVHS